MFYVQLFLQTQTIHYHKSSFDQVDMNNLEIYLFLLYFQFIGFFFQEEFSSNEVFSFFSTFSETVVLAFGVNYGMRYDDFLGDRESLFISREKLGAYSDYVERQFVYVDHLSS